MNALNAWMLSGDERDHLREQTRKQADSPSHRPRPRRVAHSLHL